MLNLLLSICWGVTLGAVVGFGWGIYQKIIRSNQNQMQKTVFLTKVVKKYGLLINLITFLFLAIGLIWTCYFMVLGILDTTQTEYATNVSQLIVSVLTVFSIMIAFYQFLKEK